jgi:hypothetical protein
MRHIRLYQRRTGRKYLVSAPIKAKILHRLRHGPNPRGYREPVCPQKSILHVWFKWLEPADKMAKANMNNITDTAFVVSVHYDDPYGAAHINVKWKGNHQIADFELDRLGEVLNCETETENTGWVIVKSSYVLNNLTVAPLSQSGPPVLQSSGLVSPGDEVPLLSDGERLNGFIRLRDGLKRVRDACNNIAFY